MAHWIRTHMPCSVGDKLCCPYTSQDRRPNCIIVHRGGDAMGRTTQPNDNRFTHWLAPLVNTGRQCSNKSRNPTDGLVLSLNILRWLATSRRTTVCLAAVNYLGIDCFDSSTRVCSDGWWEAQLGAHKGNTIIYRFVWLMVRNDADPLLYNFGKLNQYECWYCDSTSQHSGVVGQLKRTGFASSFPGHMCIMSRKWVRCWLAALPCLVE